MKCHINNNLLITFLNYENAILMRLKMRGFDFHQPRDGGISREN